MQVKDANRNRRHIGLLAGACLVAQLSLAPAIALGNGRANFALVFAASVALSIGGRVGVLSGFVSGLVFDLSTTGPIGLMALLLTVLAYALGIESRDRIADEPVRSVVVVGVAALVVSLAYHLVMLAIGQASSLFDILVLRTLPTALLTLVGYLPVGFVLWRGGSGSRHAGHYSIERADR